MELPDIENLAQCVASAQKRQKAVQKHYEYFCKFYAREPKKFGPEWPTLEEFDRAFMVLCTAPGLNENGDPIGKVGVFDSIDREFVRDILRAYKGLKPICSITCSPYDEEQNDREKAYAMKCGLIMRLMNKVQ